jgi:hypothetical protein
LHMLLTLALSIPLKKLIILKKASSSRIIRPIKTFLLVVNPK